VKNLKKQLGVAYIKRIVESEDHFLNLLSQKGDVNVDHLKSPQLISEMKTNLVGLTSQKLPIKEIKRDFSRLSIIDEITEIIQSGSSYNRD